MRAKPSRRSLRTVEEASFPDRWLGEVVPRPRDGDWGICPGTGKSHGAHVIECGRCGARRPG